MRRMRRGLIFVLMMAAVANLPVSALPLRAAAATASAPSVRSQGWAAVPHGAGSRTAITSSNLTTQTQPLQDPSFEAGSPWPAWTSSSSGGRSLIDGSAPHAGSYSAHLCQGTDGCSDQVSQAFTAPGRVLSATLTFWFRLETVDSTVANPAPCNDYVAVGLVDGSGGSGANSGLHYCEDWGATGYNQGSIDETGFLNAQAGQPVSLVAQGVTDAGGVSDFYVDDFTLTMTTADRGDATYPFSAVSTSQYRLSNSDGASWTDLDSTYLSLGVTPAVDALAIASGNADLWTANAGVNQDLGIAVSGGGYPSNGGQPEAWKESGGFAGTFSPNAAFVQSVVPLKAGTAYSFRLQWKANHPTRGGTIFAGAGLAPIFSPIRLTVQLVPQSSPPSVMGSSSRNQPRLLNADGMTWHDLDAGTEFSYTPSANGVIVLSGNADLWTENAGLNQDLGITVSDGGRGMYPTVPGQPEAWKESGGFAGTFSPNAAFVQTSLPVVAGVPYDIKLQWKTNQPARGGGIRAGAGPINGQYSPTTLMLRLFPGVNSLSSGPTVYDAASTQQYRLDGSDGAGWIDLDSSATGAAKPLTLSITPASNCVAILSGNADLWTATAGFNQDLGIQVSWPGGVLSSRAVGWKESGGFAGIFSPNAAFVQAIVPMNAGTTYAVRLQWKANHSSMASSTFAGAGPIHGNFSPTHLSAQLACP